MPPTMTDVQRRIRLVARHHLGGTAPDPVAAVRGVVAMHASDPATPHLGVRARVTRDRDSRVGGDDGFSTALYVDRSLWRLHAIRRTLFVADVADAVVLEAAAGRDVARKERRRLEGWLAAEIGADRVDRWLADVSDAVLETLRAGEPLTTSELAAVVPALNTEVTLGSGRWAQRSPISSRVLFLLAMEGAIVRAAPVGSWRSSQYRWASTASWFGVEPAWIDEPAAGRAALARRYLATHGPATLIDLRWWTGWTVKQAAAAVAAVGAVPVALEGGLEGLVLAGDEQEVVGDTGVVSLLPALDPTPMGWKQRDWFLGTDAGPCASQLYDTNGNVGPTVWVDGRIVGGWAVRADGEVVLRLLEDVGSDVSPAIEREAAALTTWLDGTPVTPRFRTPLERELTE